MKSLICHKTGSRHFHRMNFGCGNTILEGFVNIDMNFSPTILDMVGKTDLDCAVYEGMWENPHEFPVNYFKEIVAHDVLEHFHPDKIGNILYCFRCCLQKGGVLKIVVPDFELMAKVISNHSEDIALDIEWLNEFREIELNWMAPYVHGSTGHQSIWTKSIAEHRLNQEGFSVWSMINNGRSLQIEAGLAVE